MSAYRYDRIHTDDDWAAYDVIVGDAFVVQHDPEETQHTREVVGRENIRVLRADDNTIVAGLGLIPMGQYFGGRNVPMIGIGAVATDVAHRGGGAASHLMAEMVRELHGRGDVISTLYPATRRLYRRSGYEMAGLEQSVEINLQRIPIRERGPTVRRATDADRPTVEALWRRWAPTHPGNVDRGRFNWERVFNFKRKPLQGFIVEENGEPTGYLYVRHDRTSPTELANVMIHDWVAVTPAAGRRLLTALSDYQTTRSRAYVRTSAADAILSLLPEQSYEVRTHCTWMTRIVSVPRALAARGYAPAVGGELHLQVEDDVIPQNTGAWTLTVGDGVGRVAPGGRGDLRIDVRGLASLFTGFQTPQRLVQAEFASGDEGTLRLAEGIFAGSVPWMRDAF